MTLLARSDRPLLRHEIRELAPVSEPSLDACLGPVDAWRRTWNEHRARHLSLVTLGLVAALEEDGAQSARYAITDAGRAALARHAQSEAEQGDANG